MPGSPGSEAPIAGAPMPVLLLLASLAGAHPAPGHHHHEQGGSRAIGDLEVESALHQYGLPVEFAARLVTSWTHGIAAPERSRAEGRIAAWNFDDTTVRVLHQRLLDAEVLGADMGSLTYPDKPVCLSLGRAPDDPIDLLVLDPRARQRGASEEEQMSRRLAITWVEQPNQRTAMLVLRPGEQATVVELIPNRGTPPRRLARVKRSVHLTTAAVDWRLHDSDRGAEVCVAVKPVSPTARVVKGVPDLPPRPKPTTDLPPLTSL